MDKYNQSATMSEAKVNEVMGRLGLTEDQDTTEITSPEQIQLRDIDYPPDLKEHQFDTVLIYAQKDVQLALTFKDILEKFIALEDGRNAKVCVLDRGDNLCHIRSKFKHLEEAVKRSTYMFLFMSRNFVNDSWAELQGDECLQESIDNPEKRWCVIPIHTLPKKKCNYPVPFGLRALKGVHVDRVFSDPKKVFNEHINVDFIRKEDLDPYYIKQMQTLFNARLREKIERERRQAKKKNAWEKKEKLQRYHKLKEEEKQEKLNEEKHRRTLELLEKKREEDLRREQENIAKMTVNDVKLPPVPHIDLPEDQRGPGDLGMPAAVVKIYMRGQDPYSTGSEMLSSSMPVSIHRRNNDDRVQTPDRNSKSPPRSFHRNYTEPPDVSVLKQHQDPRRGPSENSELGDRTAVENKVSFDNGRESEGRQIEKNSDETEPLKRMATENDSGMSAGESAGDSMRQPFSGGGGPSKSKPVSETKETIGDSQITYDADRSSLSKLVTDSGRNNNRLLLKSDDESLTVKKERIRGETEIDRMKALYESVKTKENQEPVSVEASKAVVGQVSNITDDQKQNVQVGNQIKPDAHKNHSTAAMKRSGCYRQVVRRSGGKSHSSSKEATHSREEVEKQASGNGSSISSRVPSGDKEQKVGEIVLPEQPIQSIHVEANKTPIPVLPNNFVQMPSHGPQSAPGGHGTTSYKHETPYNPYSAPAGYIEMPNAQKQVPGAQLSPKHPPVGPMPDGPMPDGPLPGVVGPLPGFRSAVTAYNQPHGIPGTQPGAHFANGGYTQTQQAAMRGWQSAPGALNGPAPQAAYPCLLPAPYDQQVVHQMMQTWMMMYRHPPYVMHPPSAMTGLPYYPYVPPMATHAPGPIPEHPADDSERKHSDVRKQSDTSSGDSVSLRSSLYLSEGAFENPSQDPTFKANLPSQPVTNVTGRDGSPTGSFSIIPDTPHPSMFVSGQPGHGDLPSAPSSGYGTADTWRFESIKDPHFVPKINLKDDLDEVDSVQMNSGISQQDELSESSYGGSTFIQSGRFMSQNISGTLPSADKSKPSRQASHHNDFSRLNQSKSGAMPDFNALEVSSSESGSFQGQPRVC